MVLRWAIPLLAAQRVAGAKGDGRSLSDRDYSWDQDRDLLFGGGYGGGGYGGSGYGSKDLYGASGSFRDPLGSYGGSYNRDWGLERKEEDDCQRLEAHGVPLAEALRDAAGLLLNSGEVAAELRHLVELFAAARHRRFLMAHCPQAVVLATLLEVDQDASAGEDSVKRVREVLAAVPTVRAAYRTPQWTGAPWEPLLNSAQQRTGVLLFPTGDQHQFHVERLDDVQAKWRVHPRRHCVGRRDLGNLQATPLESCLGKCLSHPLCKSATFWQWQPGGYGFEQRCFLSSTCTEAQATAEGADGAILFEKNSSQSAREEALTRRTILTPGGALWAPRCGHRVVATQRSGGAATRFWLLGGVGVDVFAKNSTPEHAGGEAESRLDSARRLGQDARVSAGKRSQSQASRSERTGTEKPQRRNSTRPDVVESYLSRHVALSGEMPPLRSLPYGRMGDLWQSDDLGSTWSLVSSEAPWGSRAFFGAVAVAQGRALLVLGGVRSPKSNSDGSAKGDSMLPREYVNDVWWASLDTLTPEWQQMASAPWTPRAAFQALALEHSSSDDGTSTSVLVMGGRAADGILLNDVWMGAIVSGTQPAIKWQLLSGSAPWAPRSDFAATAGYSSDIWVLGGCDQAGRPLRDVWWSATGETWKEVVHSAPWGHRIGPAAVTLSTSSEEPGAIVLFGGFSYPGPDFKPLTPNTDDLESAGAWGTASWVSYDGLQWQPLNITRMSWEPHAMHAALVSAPCGGSRNASCAYAAGGLTHEGYYDNSVHRLFVPTSLRTTLKGASASISPVQVESIDWKQRSVELVSGSWQSGLVSLAVVSMFTIYILRRSCCGRTRVCPEVQCSPVLQLAVCSLVCLLLLLVATVAFLSMAVLQLRLDFHRLQKERASCEIDMTSAKHLGELLGLPSLTDQWEQYGTLLRLALREPQFGYGSLGGYQDYWRGTGRDSLGGYGSRSHDHAYGYDGGYYGYHSSQASSSHGSGYGIQSPTLDDEGDQKTDSPARDRDLALLPTTQGLTCRSPRCERNSTICSAGVPRSLGSPHGCCSDYMLIMLRDVTDWLTQHNIPYFVTYGTLLGALRSGEILPYTQDMDIVVDRRYWLQLQRGLEAAEFFGGRRYLFGVDQWEERVSRVCADWEGFATSTIGGPDGDRFSRATEFHLDVYASDWWQIKDLHLVDCVEPLGTTAVNIHGLNFSAPARPRACIEKLYGADWRVPKHALAGVN